MRIPGARIRDRQALDRHLSSLHAVRLMKERVAADRLGGLLVGAPDAAAERALMGIVLDAFGQGEELEDVLVEWRREVEGEAPAPRAEERELPFNDLVESFLEVKEQAAAVYANAAKDCPREDLAERLRRLGLEDAGHAEVLKEILDRSRR